MLGCFLDVGSTFTKARIIDLEEATLVASTAADTTVETNVMAGVDTAMAAIEADTGLAPSDFDRRFASSSAAGGLRVVVIGFSPNYTLEAGNRAALGAGANIVDSFTWYVDDGDLAEVREASPDLILLTGGTDGGNARALRANAETLASAGLGCPVVLAGNAEVSTECTEMLEAAGYPVTVAENILGDSPSEINPTDAREKIRNAFFEQITEAKGIDQLREFITEREILPTPEAVSLGCQLAAEGAGGVAGLGPTIGVDVGGATTDVHSIGSGEPTHAYVELSDDLEEPYRKRTVEADLGIRWNAVTIVERFGADEVAAHLADASITAEEVRQYAERVRADTGAIPATERESRLDRALASVATRAAVEQHAGRLQRTERVEQQAFSGAGEAGEVGSAVAVEAAEGKQDRLPTKYVQVGKDLSEFAVVIGTGGILANHPDAMEILRTVEEMARAEGTLLPAAPEYRIDEDYLLYACGLMAESFPETAVRTLQTHLR